MGIIKGVKNVVGKNDKVDAPFSNSCCYPTVA